MEFKINEKSLPNLFNSTSSKLLIKGMTIGVMIIVLLIPTAQLTHLITERQKRQQQVVKEISDKWATAQHLSGPYIVVPYTYIFTNDSGKLNTLRTQLIVLADKLNVSGNLYPENRNRSIYKVLLYKTALTFSGNFKPEWPTDIIPENIDFGGAKLCFGLSDFKGLEEGVIISFNNQQYSLSPGLPVNNVSAIGLATPVTINADMLKNGIPFSLSIKIKGSDQLHFLPLAANSYFEIKSPWPNPSFDGNVLPNNRTVNSRGFDASWYFTKANLPFSMVTQHGKFSSAGLNFGISMVQPAEHYEKTMRSVKYALLLIGLTFALIFSVEILQKKPFHPLQYLLVGFALLIFYTLLLSMSEVMLFDYAYATAATGTILLISLYAKNHFAKWAIAGAFAAALGCLYGFIYLLICLQDTSLLIGSIGLFIALAIVMYLSSKINWYGNPSTDDYINQTK